MGYPSDLLSSRAVVKPGMYAIIPPEGRVFNVIPGIEGCRMTILCTPKMGAGFVQHIGTALPGGGTTVPYGASGRCHPFVETHVQEHGAYLYEGEGLYLLNDDWVPVKAEDFIWMGAYCKQCCYGVGLTRLSYIYSKDCHRDAEI